jgi:DNA-binding GntR family transcriptional regulator
MKKSRKDINVSRTPVKMALNRLSKGLVKIYPNREHSRFICPLKRSRKLYDPGALESLSLEMAADSASN